MLLKSSVYQVIELQSAYLNKGSDNIERDVFPPFPVLGSHAFIVSGIRRCGKSTLLHQWRQTNYPDALYLNFEDSRLYGFDQNDFLRLDEVIAESKTKVLFFDEIQIIEAWEMYIRQKLDEGFKVAISGSNASLLSREMGTKLTGRHLTKELFPFSFSEFCRFKNLPTSVESMEIYLEQGGFPEYLRDGNEAILMSLFENILLKDIIVRYNIRDSKLIQRLAQFLISNVGNLVTGNKLKPLFGINSTATILEYFSHLEEAYLFFFVSKFSFSIKQQLINPRKIYSIDSGVITVNSATFTEDAGHKLENIVFLHYRRKYKDIYYYAETGECDFVVCDRGTVIAVVQVCYTLTPDNLSRELNGLLAALKQFNLSEGTIVTFNQNDLFQEDGKVIKAIPCHEFLLL
jgi:predicted AAA+ superfamily ATPase